MQDHKVIAEKDVCPNFFEEADLRFQTQKFFKSQNHWQAE